MESKIMMARYCKDGETDVIDTYLKRMKVDLNEVYDERFGGGRDQPPRRKKTTYLLTAVRQGYAGTVETLLRHKANPHKGVKVVDEEGQSLGEDTPMSVATAKGRLDIMTLLAKYGVKVQFTQQHLATAVERNDQEAVEFLLQEGGLKPTPDLILVAARARKRVSVDLLPLLITEGALYEEAFLAALDRHYFYFCNWLLSEELVVPQESFLLHAVRTNNIRAVDYCVNKGCPAAQAMTLTHDPELLRILRRRTPRQNVLPRQISVKAN
ncbi:MAG: ankyrin repeat domain-containing protein [Nitrososphaerales archaeon]